MKNLYRYAGLFIKCLISSKDRVNLHGDYFKNSNFPYLKNLVPHKTLKEVQEYWKSPNDEANLPYAYLKGEERSKFLVDIFNEHNIEKQSRILEMECNVGRNLNFLFQAGYKNLNGIEINSEAIELMKSKYPEMVKHAHIYNSTIEEKIKQLDDSSFDSVYYGSIGSYPSR